MDLVFVENGLDLTVFCLGGFSREGKTWHKDGVPGVCWANTPSMCC